MPSNEPLPIEIDVAAVKKLCDECHDFVLLDCREEDEFAVARIAGAVLVPLSQLPERSADLDAYRDRHLVVHCHHGVRSLRLTQMLRAGGFERVQSMAGGIDAWSQQVDRSVPRY